MASRSDHHHRSGFDPGQLALLSAAGLRVDRRRLLTCRACQFDFHVSKADAFTRHLRRRLPLMVCSGSLADILRCGSNARFAPESGHRLAALRCLLCANSGHPGQDEA